MTRFFLWIILAGIIFATGCKKDTVSVSDRKIILNSPPDDHYTNEDTLIFWWGMAEGIDEYRFQLVSPSFSNISFLMADTVVSRDKVRWHLPEGRYEWRVRGERGSDHTEYSRRSLTVDRTAPSLPSLVSPADQDTTWADSLLLQWSSADNTAGWTDSVLVYSEDPDSLPLAPWHRAVVSGTYYNLSANASLDSTGMRYYWRIISRDRAGNRSASFTRWFFYRK